MSQLFEVTIAVIIMHHVEHIVIEIICARESSPFHLQF